MAVSTLSGLQNLQVLLYFKSFMILNVVAYTLIFKKNVGTSINFVLRNTVTLSTDF